MTGILDLIGGGFLVLGAGLGLVGAIGLVRLPDMFGRMHAATKPQTLGLLLVLTGLALVLRTWSSVTTMVIVLGAQALTAPVAAHLLGRATHRTGTLEEDLLVRDELADAQRRAASSSQEGEPAPPEDQGRP